MEKHKPVKITRDSSTGRFSGGYRVLGTTRDGVAILKPKGSATHFTDKELVQAIQAARSKDSSRATAKKG